MARFTVGRCAVAIGFAVGSAYSKSALEAQSSAALEGRWEVEYERGRRIEDGVATPIMGKSTLSIQSQGDTLVVTIEAGKRPDGGAIPARSFGARKTATGVTFVQREQARLNANGQESVVEATITWTLQANGDELTGSIQREIPVVIEPLPATPVKGIRLKA